MKILVAPDKFKDALEAPEVAAALTDGIRNARPEAQVLACPLGDGGEGTGQLLAAALHAQTRTCKVLDPLGRPRMTTWWYAAEPRLGIIEMAQASGLALLSPHERDPLRTTTYGTGQLLRAAAEAGAERVLLCVGGSATVDGGAGCLQALGCRLIDSDGQEIRGLAAGGMLSRITALRRGAALPLTIDVLCDVDNPLLGPRGTAPVFAPQKGATPEAVTVLDQALSHWARIIARDLGCTASSAPRTGAAGGLPFGLMAAFHARLLSGFDEVARRLQLDRKLTDCHLCLTGEGCIDEQTSGGKVVAGVARLAGQRGVPVLAVAGSARPRPGQTIDDLARALGLERIVVITPPGTPIQQALASTKQNLRRAAAAVVTARQPLHQEDR